MLSLVLLVIVVGNVFLTSFKMNQIDLEKSQENIALTSISRATNSPYYTAENEYTANLGTLLTGSYAGTRLLGDSSYETFREENSQSNSSFYPTAYTLNGGTSFISGDISNLINKDGARMTFGSYPSSFTAQSLYAHKETTNIAGTTYNQSKLTSADASGATLTASLNNPRTVLDKSVYSLQGLSSIPASTWTMYYRAWKDSATSQPTNNPSSTSGGWTNPSNAYADGGSYASSTMSCRQAYNSYNFAVPGAPITQVRVRLDAYVSGGDGNDKILLEVSDGTSWLATTQQQNLTGSETTYWIDVTGWTSWTPAKANSIQTRVSQIRVGSTADEVRLDWIPVEVTYSTSTNNSNPASANGGTGGGWSSLSNAYADDSFYASSDAANEQATYWGYGFSLPANAVVTQVQVRLDAYSSGFSSFDDIRLEASSDGGSSWLPASPPVQQLTSSQATYWIDITSWAGWNPTNIGNIRTRVTHILDGSLNTVYVDYIPIEVTFTIPTVITQSPTSNSAGWTNPTNAYANGGSYAQSYSDVDNKEQVYGGYGFAIPSGAQVTQVRVRLDAWSSYDDHIKVEVSADGGSTWLSTTQELSPALSETTYWVDISSWTSWTPASLNSDSVKVRLTHVLVTAAGYVYLDWMPVEVTYSIPVNPHADVDLLVRKSDGTIRTTIATNVAVSADLQTTAQTLTGTYAWPGYTVVSQTDYLEIDYCIDTATMGSINAYLLIEDNTLGASSQTRTTNIQLPSQHTIQLELTGTGNIPTGLSLLWNLDSAFNVASVTTTLQMYNYNGSQYPSSGDGYLTYVSSATPNTPETKSQTVIQNPTYFLSQTEVWKMRITATLNVQFTVSLDWAEFKALAPNTYSLSITNSYTLDTESYPVPYLHGFEIIFNYAVSDVNTTCFVKAYNWATSTFSNLGFNDTGGNHQTTPGNYWNYSLSVTGTWADYVSANGNIILQFYSVVDPIQTTVSLDFVGLRALIDGTTLQVKNSSPESVQMIAFWITNSAAHQRYNADLFLNSGESAEYTRADVTLPQGTYLIKIVTERGNTAIFSNS
jgi:hypothetical protein